MLCIKFVCVIDCTLLKLAPSAFAAAQTAHAKKVPLGSIHFILYGISY